MATSTRGRPSTVAPGDGSRTLTMTNDPTRETDSDGEEGGEANPDPSANGVVGSLRLRAGTRRPRQRVVWKEDVVDNEGQGKKKSKICCIYHKPRRFDESSDESDSDSDSDVDHSHHNHNHNHGHDHPHSSAGPSSHGLLPPNPNGGVVHELEPTEDDSNAYEKQPTSNKGKRKA
ncbi:hypothetical protein GALMADRAFT_247379, partial [Galerina marginata CBS 339.88]